MKKVVKKALKRAKQIEKHKLLTKKEISSIGKERQEEASKLKQLLKPSWFLGKKNDAVQKEVEESARAMKPASRKMNSKSGPRKKPHNSR